MSTLYISLIHGINTVPYLFEQVITFSSLNMTEKIKTGTLVQQIHVGVLYCKNKYGFQFQK